MRFYFLLEFLLSLFIFSKSDAQRTYLIYDRINEKPLPFAFVMFGQKNEGTVADKNGKVVLPYGSFSSIDSLTISHVSYNPKTVSFNDIVFSDTIFMEIRILENQNVIIVSRKKKKIGIKRLLVIFNGDMKGLIG